MNRDHDDPNRKRSQLRAAARDAALEPGQSSRSAALSRRANVVASGLVQRKAQAESGAGLDAPPAVQIAAPGEPPMVQLKCAKCGEEDEKAKRRHEQVHAASEALQIQRAPAQLGDEDEEQQAQVPANVLELLQLKRSQGGPSEPVPHVESYLQASRGGGAPLPQDVRSELEPRFGADFSEVRVHTDSAAARVSQALGAHAFAYGRDIYFGAGQYNPHSTSGRWLLAHELTHTVQQTGARPPGVQTHLVVGKANDAYEQEADRVADAVTSMSAPSPAPSTTEVARKADDTTGPGTEAPEVAEVLMLQRHAANLLDMVGLSAPESIQGHLFGGDCVAEYWNLSAAIASFVAAAGGGIALALTPEPTTATKWAAVGAAAAALSAIAWIINAIIALVACKRALEQTDERVEEIRRLEARQHQLERSLRELQRQLQQQQSPPPQQQPTPPPN